MKILNNIDKLNKNYTNCTFLLCLLIAVCRIMILFIYLIEAQYSYHRCNKPLHVIRFILSNFILNLGTHK